MSRMPVYNLEWQEPPSADKPVIDMILAQLQNNPGKWARICKDRSQTALANDWLKLGTEARAVRNNPGDKPARYDIYARWPQGKAPTISQSIRDEVGRTTASARPPATTRVQQAVAQGRALTPAPATGGYLAARAARGINPEGTMP